MRVPILDSLALVDASGHFIIFAIVLTLVGAIAASGVIRARYARMERLLGDAEPSADGGGSHAVLDPILRQCRDAARQGAGEVNTQAIIEQNFQSRLKLLLVGERFIRASVGLSIVLGLIGTFYGLTLSIGKLVSLITSESPAGGDVAEAVTSGLTQALSGMSVAFTTSLFGIGAAVILILFNVFANVTDRRTALMVRIETFVDEVLAREGLAGDTRDARFEHTITSFGQSVGRLEEAVTRFDAALLNFAATTRDFREFNLHLKDNVQRMSLSFGDFSEAMKNEIGALKARSRS